MSFPLDLSFTDWTPRPAGTRKPGASDMDRIQEAIKNLANPPSAALGRTDTELIVSDLQFHGLYWNKPLWETDSRMIGNGVDATHYTDRILLPEVGEWELACTIRTRTNNSLHYGQLQLVLVDENNTVTTLIDEATADNALERDSTLHCHTHFVLNATQVANGTAVRAQYAQDSGGDNSIRVTSPAYAGIPILRARWVGKGGL